MCSSERRVPKSREVAAQVGRESSRDFEKFSGVRGPYAAEPKGTHGHVNGIRQGTLLDARVQAKRGGTIDKA